MDAYTIAIVLSALIILSSVFTNIFQKLRIPSVLLLMGTGIVLQQIVVFFDLEIGISRTYVEFFGLIGLIMIVLEATMDLIISKKTMNIIFHAFFSALIIFILSSVFIGLALNLWLKETFIKCFLYAIPLATTSSAIVIPSIHHLSQQKKEFLIYETSFSDIIGILCFNFIITNDVFTPQTFAEFGGMTVLAIVLSIIITIGLLYFLVKTHWHIKYFFLFSLLIFIYTIGKQLHFPSLIVILVFGLLLNNWSTVRQLFDSQRVVRLFSPKDIEPLLKMLRIITAESSFVIRTIFFTLLGFSINLQLAFSNEVLVIGSVIVAILLLIRLVYLKYDIQTSIFPELFFMPRGLITVVLFFKIPQKYLSPDFNEGILFYVILLTSLIMMFGMFFKNRSYEFDEKEKTSLVQPIHTMDNALANPDPNVAVHSFKTENRDL